LSKQVRHGPIPNGVCDSSRRIANPPQMWQSAPQLSTVKQANGGFAAEALY